VLDIDSFAVDTVLHTQLCFIYQCLRWEEYSIVLFSRIVMLVYVKNF